MLAWKPKERNGASIACTWSLYNNFFQSISLKNQFIAMLMNFYLEEDSLETLIVFFGSRVMDTKKGKRALLYYRFGLTIL